MPNVKQKKIKEPIKKITKKVPLKERKIIKFEGPMMAVLEAKLYVELFKLDIPNDVETDKYIYKSLEESVKKSYPKENQNTINSYLKHLSIYYQKIKNNM